VIVLDTTVLVYAKGMDHPLREPCRELMRAIEAGRLLATTTAEVIQEFAHVRARRRDRADATALAQAYVDLLAPLLLIEEDTVKAGLSLFETHPQLGSFDAVLAAAAIEAGADALVSADGAFAGVAGLAHIDPSTQAMRELLKD
jgi:uncharacterized protein